MLKNKIIEELYKSKEVDDVLKKIQPADIQDDLRQYVFQVLCEKPDDFIIDLYNQKKIKFYLVKIITNSVFANVSGFYKIHKNSKEVHCEQFEDVVDEDSNHEFMERCEKEVKELYWYNEVLLRMYAEHGSYRAVSVKTGIPVKSVFNAVRKAKNQIKSNIWKQ